MSGQYDPTNLRDDRHPLRALGMSFGQREAMDQQDQAMMPQYQPAPLASQLMARPNPMMGPGSQAAGRSPFGNIGAMSSFGQQLGRGAMNLYDWAQPARQELAMSGASMPKAMSGGS